MFRFATTFAIAILSTLSLASPIASPAEPAELEKRGGEGLHLVNCQKTNTVTSAMWYYVTDGNKSPSDVAVISTGYYTTWEGQSISGHFESGVTFTSNIQSGAQYYNNYQYAGSGYNGANWNCYKDDGHIIANSGCKSIYYCLKA